MARHLKKGVDYFPHDVDLSQDPKIEFLEAAHGLIGYGVYLKLLEKAYREGYGIPWSHRDSVLLAHRARIDAEIVDKVIQTCLEEKLFDRTVFERSKVLTSRAIQDRYLRIIEKRKDKSIPENLRLAEIPISGHDSLPETPISSESIRVNSPETGDDSEEMTQSKVKGKEVEEVKEDTVTRRHATSVKDLENLDFVLRLHDDEFKPYVTKVLGMCSAARFIWQPTTGSVESDIRGLIYPRGMNDEDKKKILFELFNVYGQRLNWPTYVLDWVRHTLRTAQKTRVPKPFGFIRSQLDKPSEIVSSKADGLLSKPLGQVFAEAKEGRRAS